MPWRLILSRQDVGILDELYGVPVDAWMEVVVAEVATGRKMVGK
jgi:hypothetical protein